MYVCQECQEPQAKGEKSYRKVVGYREKMYAPRSNANPRRPAGEGRADPGGKGLEIVAEKVVCKECYEHN